MIDMRFSVLWTIVVLNVGKSGWDPVVSGVQKDTVLCPCCGPCT